MLTHAMAAFREQVQAACLKGKSTAPLVADYGEYGDLFWALELPSERRDVADPATARAVLAFAENRFREAERIRIERNQSWRRY